MENMHKELTALREQCKIQLAEAEEKFQQLQAEIQEFRRKITAIDTLIGPDDSIAKARSAATQFAPDEDERDFTPVKAYWQPILQALVELGGKGHRVDVINLVGEKMKDILTEADKGKLPKSGYSRWRNRVAWQASQMRNEDVGFIKNDSRRGIWEITEAGRKSLDDKSN